MLADAAQVDKPSINNIPPTKVTPESISLTEESPGIEGSFLHIVDTKNSLAVS
jgi:hypothetical protein